MPKYSDAQLMTLARIKFSGLLYFYSGELPLAYLVTPIPNQVRVNSATIRRLERDELIERDPEVEPGECLWRVSRSGEALLRENKQYLEPAGREAALIEGRHVLALLGVQLTRPE